MAKDDEIVDSLSGFWVHGEVCGVSSFLEKLGRLSVSLDEDLKVRRNFVQPNWQRARELLCAYGT